LKTINKEQAEKELKKRADTVSADDLQKVTEKQNEIEKKFKTNSSLSRFLEDLNLLFRLIKDYISGEYKEVPWWSIAAIVAALLYVLNPIDLIPDIIPFIGYIDDAMVIAACLKMVEADLLSYTKWKNKNI